MSKAAHEAEAPALKGWMTAVQAADVLGITRQSVTRMMSEGTFRTRRSVGDRPLYLVRVEEVRRYLELFDEYGTWGRAAEELLKQAARKVGLDKADR